MKTAIVLTWNSYLQYTEYKIACVERTVYIVHYLVYYQKIPIKLKSYKAKIKLISYIQNELNTESQAFRCYSGIPVHVATGMLRNHSS